MARGAIQLFQKTFWPRQSRLGARDERGYRNAGWRWLRIPSGSISNRLRHSFANDSRAWILSRIGAIVRVRHGLVFRGE